MKRYLMISGVGLLLANSNAIGAQVVSAHRGHATGDGGVAQTIADLENQWVRSIEKKVAATLRSMLAPSYNDTNEEGNQSTREEMLATLASADVKVESITISDVKVTRYGDAAVATGSAVQKGSYKGQAFAPKIVFTDTFVRQNGSWRAVASQRIAVH